MSPLHSTLLFLALAVFVITDLCVGVFMASDPYRRWRRGGARASRRSGVGWFQQHLHLPHPHH